MTTEQKTVRKRKTLEELTIQDDYLFKRIMSEKDICIKFVQIILGIDIKDIVYIKAEEAVKELYDSKGIRLDVYLKDEDGVVYNIEMQVTSLGEEEFAKRFRYYEAMIDSYLLKTGQKYRDLNKLFIVFICPFGIFKSERTIYTFKNFCAEDKSIELKDDVTKIFITTKSPNKENLSEDFLALLKYIDGNITDNPFVNELENKINEIKKDEKERGAYMQYDLHLMQIEEEARAEGEKIGRAEGEKIGRAEGEKIGRVEGEKIGRVEGEKIGEKKERQNMILFQKNKGRKPEEIADWLGYSLEEVLKYYNASNLNYT